MSYDFNRSWLLNKFEEIKRRILKAIDQLNDDQLNWRPNEASHSIATLIKHIDGNIQERIMKGILHQEIQRNRDDELRHSFIKRSDLEDMIDAGFQVLLNTVESISDEQLEETQLVRQRTRSNLDMLHQCAAHYSEHMGQIFYIAKQRLNHDYKSTSI